MKETIKLTNMEIVNILRSLNAPDGFFKSADPDKKLPVTLLFTISKKKNELFSIENDVEIDMINVNNIANLSLTPADFQAISFMITDEE